MAEAVEAKQVLWCLKHAPRSLEEFAGNEEVREIVRKWALNWSRGRRGKPLLLHGPTGCGKTTLVLTLARETNWTLTELSASSSRATADSSQAFQTSLQDLFRKTRLVFFDEVDWALDKGTMPALLRLLKENPCPIILVADDAWNPRLKAVRAHCTLLEMKKINWREIARVLEGIAQKEKIKTVFVEDVEEIACASNGDLRSAINDLQASTGGEALVLGERNRVENVFECLRKIFGAKSFLDALKAGDESDLDLRMLLRWVEENIALEFEDAGELSAAFECVSRADVFEGRIRTRQDYGLLKYVRALGLGGVSSARTSSARKFVRYQFPSSIKRLSETRQSRELLNKIVSKTMRALHCSRPQAIETLFMLVGRKELKEFLELSDEEEKLFSEFYHLQEHEHKKTT